MKKLLTTLAVALVAASTHAGAINWSLDFSEMPPTPGAYGNTNPNPYYGYVAYLVTADQLAALTNSEGLLLEEGWGAPGSTLASLTVTKKGGGAIDVGEWINTSFDVYTILFSTAGAVVAGTTGYSISGPVTLVFGPSGNPEANFEYGTFPAWETNWEPIPEPATMALLGIGIVAVGLRRRRK